MKRYAYIVFLLLMSVQLAIAQSSRYEYWFDNDYKGRTVSSIASKELMLTLDISRQQFGFHYFNIRTQDSKTGQWGGLARYIYMLQDASSTASMARYEYWLDNDYAGRTVKTNSGSLDALFVDINHLHPGLHYFNFRTQSVSGTWGVLARYLFMIKHDIGDISSLEYWIDDNQSESQTIDVTSNSIEITIDINGLEPEVTHTFNIIGKNGSAATSLVESYVFTISTSGVVSIVKDNEDVIVHRLDGTLLKRGKRDEVIKTLPNGVYVVDGKKIILK